MCADDAVIFTHGKNYVEMASTLANKVKFSLQNFKQVRPFLKTKAAKLFFYTMIFFFHILSIVL